jgi:hypothetical protein
LHAASVEQTLQVRAALVFDGQQLFQVV